MAGMNSVAPIGVVLGLLALLAQASLPGLAATGHPAVHEHKMVAVHLYMVAIGDNGRRGAKLGCGDSLVPVTGYIRATRAPLTATYRLFLSDHRRTYGLSGLYNALYQSRLTVARASVVGGRANVYLIGRMQLNGECDNPRVMKQLRRLAFQFRTVHSVAIYVNGVPLYRRLSLKG